MELSEFISKTISDIVTGINTANESVGESGAIICPSNVYPAEAKWSGTGVVGHIQASKSLNRAVHSVEFDVAITVQEGKETKGGIGISIANIGLGAQGKSDANKGSVSRIKFSIPVAYPQK